MPNLKDNISKYYPLKSDKERILLIGHQADMGGGEILVKNMINELKRQDVEVVAFIKKDGPLIEAYEEIAPTFIIKNESDIEAYVKELRKYGFDSAIVNTVISGNFIPYLKKHDYYVITLVHELPGMIKSLNAEDLARIVSQQSDLVIFPSNYVSEKFERENKVQNKQIKPQGLYNAYSNFGTEKSKKKIREKHNIPQDHHIILNVARGELRKGYDLFIEAFKILNRDKYTFIWAGHIDANLMEEYQELVDSSDNLIITGFISDNDELMSYYDACDLFLLPSREDPFPSVVLEAFNAKKPVIAFEDAGGFRDIVIDDVSGYLVAFESVSELVEKITLICNDEKLKESLGENAGKISENYSFEDYTIFLKIACRVGNFKINEVNALKNEIFKLSYENEKLINKNKKADKRNIQLEDVNKKFKNENKKLKKENAKIKKSYEDIKESKSWKITRPLRTIKKLIFN